MPQSTRNNTPQKKKRFVFDAMLSYEMKLWQGNCVYKEIVCKVHCLSSDTKLVHKKIFCGYKEIVAIVECCRK